MTAQETINENLEKVHALRLKLERTDYRAIKYAEGEITAEEYAETKEKRKALRAEINDLLEQNKALYPQAEKERETETPIE